MRSYTRNIVRSMYVFRRLSPKKMGSSPSILLAVLCSRCGRDIYIYIHTYIM